MCYIKTFYVDVNAFLPQNLMTLKADISKTSFFFSFSYVEIQNALVYKKKTFSGEVNWVHQALMIIVLNN